MFLFAALLVLAFCVQNVTTKNETLQHGWVREPTGRGTWSILWSCLSTIFICTWTVLYLNVPTSKYNWLYLRLRKVASFLLAIIAPELLLLRSVDYLLRARILFKFFEERSCQGWTLTHAQFAVANGFHIDTPEGNARVVSSKELRNLIDDNRMDGPPISEDELKSRGKSDSMIKLMAILQIIWFAIQTFVRTVEHYQITAIEIMTLGFALCSTFTYGLHWHQPQNAEQGQSQN